MSNLDFGSVHDAIDAAAQQSLPLGDAPADDASLRIAYSSVPELARNGITFERAIQIDSIRRCLTNIIEASLRAQTEARKQ
jgi:hypothetical protein